MPLIQLSNRNLETYYELLGNPNNPALVMINGFTRDHNTWKKMIDDLASKYYLLIFDNRGVGQTHDNGKPFTVEIMADDTIALINALKLDRPFIAGHSLGGAIAQTIAKKYPSKIQKIALCNTFTKLNEKAKEAFKNTLAVHQSGASQAEIIDTLIPWVFSKSFVTPEVRAMIHQLSNANPYPQSAFDYQRQLTALNNFDSNDWIDRIKVPTLVIGSLEDVTATFVESQQLASKIYGAKLESLPGAHGCYTEQPQLLVKKNNKFYVTSFRHTYRQRFVLARSTISVPRPSIIALSK